MYLSLPRYPAHGASRMLQATNYGPSIALAAAYEAAVVFSQPAWVPTLNSILEPFASNTSGIIYGILHGRDEHSSQGYSIGDQLGLMPIAFMARAEAARTPYPSGDDWKLAETVADEYVLTWPLRLPDGTVSRHVGSWGPGEPDEGNGSFLWSDDVFMGTALLCRLATTPGVPASNARAYARAAGTQLTQFAAHTQDKATGLFRHGFNAATNHTSCCRWGRSNGWILMAAPEIASALSAAAPGDPLLDDVLRVWRAHVAGFAAVHPPAGDGRWHQVLDEPSTFLETSVSAMAVFSIATGITRGWLDSSYAPLVRAAWAGVAGAVAADGTVSSICAGTGIGNTVAFYEARPTDYLDSDPGLGAVFRAALAIEALNTVM